MLNRYLLTGRSAFNQETDLHTLLRLLGHPVDQLLLSDFCERFAGNLQLRQWRNAGSASSSAAGGAGGRARQSYARRDHHQLNCGRPLSTRSRFVIRHAGEMCCSCKLANCGCRRQSAVGRWRTTMVTLDPLLHCCSNSSAFACTTIFYFKNNSLYAVVTPITPVTPL